MRIYTKHGDKGETGLFGGKRVSKDSPRIEVIGSVDELNAMIGLARSCSKERIIVGILKIIQDDLFILGADMAAPEDQISKLPLRISLERVSYLEDTIDSIEKKIPRLTHFILPGGGITSSTLHVARAICRRVERLTVMLSKMEKINLTSIIYLNRLSDLIFVLSRYSNKLEGTREYKWRVKPHLNS